MVLSYAKIAVLVLPLMAAFALWVWITRAQFTLPTWRNLLLCAGIFGLLAVLPNLPTLRENQFVAMFDLGPLRAGKERSPKNPRWHGWIAMPCSAGHRVPGRAKCARDRPIWD